MIRIPSMNKRPQFLLCILVAFFLINAIPCMAQDLNALKSQKTSVFRLHLFSEPTSVSVLTQKSSSSMYFLGQMTCPLQKWRNSKLIEGTAKCKAHKKEKQIVCHLNSKAKYSDGTSLNPSDYQNTFLSFLSPQKPAPRADLFFAIKNARAYLSGKANKEAVGLRADDKKRTLTFELDSKYSTFDFLKLLANPLFTAEDPLSQTGVAAWNKIKSCGAYAISDWRPGLKVQLKPNPHWISPSARRPLLEYYFVSEDMLALQLYEKGELDFLRRLPTLALPKYEKSPELHKVDQIRLDYIAPNESQRHEPELARALGASLDFAAWQSLYHAKPRPGCFGIPANWSKSAVCIDTDLALAKILAQSYLSKNTNPPPLKLSYSKQGGDDHERTMSFLTEQWRKNLNLKVQTDGLDNKIFLSQLSAGKLDLFRKGVAPERSSCLALIENFESHSPENYAQVKSTQLDQLIERMRKSETENPTDCETGLKILKDEFFLIPTGPIYFSILAKQKWQGWHLNELNHLDLAELKELP